MENINIVNGVLAFALSYILFLSISRMKKLLLGLSGKLSRKNTENK